MKAKYSWFRLMVIACIGLALAGVLFNCAKGTAVIEAETDVFEEPAMEETADYPRMMATAALMSPQKKKKSFLISY